MQVESFQTSIWASALSSALFHKIVNKKCLILLVLYLSPTYLRYRR